MQRPPSTGRYAARDAARADTGPLGGDPRAVTPNANLAGPNTPPQSVGPTSSTNAPGNFVLQASAWSGWPGPGSEGVDSVWATPPLEQFSDTIGAGGEWSGFGYGRQNPGGYLKRVSTVMTCADLNGRQLASFPAYAVKNRRPQDLPNWYQTSPEPSYYSDWVAFMKVAANSFQLGGECIVWCLGRYANDYPARFVVLNPRAVFIDDDDEYYLGTDDTGEHLNRRDICHVNYQQLPSSRRGIGPLSWAGYHLISAAVLSAYAVQLARQGVWAVLKHPEGLTAEQAADLQGQWLFARYQANGAPAVLSGGVELETLTMSPRDLTLLDLKTFDLQMICAAFGVPPFLVGLPQPGSMTYSSANMLTDFHWRSTLRPMAQAFSGALSPWLLPRGTALEFNPDRYIQPGPKERAETYAILHAIVNDAGQPALTVDEIREAERWTPYGNDANDPSSDISGLIGSTHG